MRESVNIISAPVNTTFAQSLDALNEGLTTWLRENQLTKDALLWARLYMSDPANQVDAVWSHELYVQLLSSCAFSHIGQPVINGPKASLMFAVDMDSSVCKQGTAQQMAIKSGATTMLYHSIRLTDKEAAGLTPKEQTELIFERHIAWLSERGLTLKDNCIRTWLFVRDIDHNYADVMKGRNSVFDREGLTPDTHFIASTGIGGYTESSQAVIAIDFLSIDQPEHSPKYLEALEYLNPTHQYGVAFERGVKFSAYGADKIFISGTASIDKFGQCLHLGDVAKQTDRLFENISQLLADADRTLADITYLVVYLRDISDYQIVSDYMTAHYPNLPYVITEAYVCRPQWLVEVECVAR